MQERERGEGREGGEGIEKEHETVTTAIPGKEGGRQSRGEEGGTDKDLQRHLLPFHFSLNTIFLNISN